MYYRKYIGNGNESMVIRHSITDQVENTDKDVTWVRMKNINTETIDLILSLVNHQETLNNERSN